MGDVELIVEAELPAWTVDVAALREALTRSGVDVREPGGSAAPAATVVVADLERAGSLLQTHAGRPGALVIVQGDHFPFLGEPQTPTPDIGAGVLFCVWGSAARDELARRFPGARIVVTGLPRADPDLARQLPHASPPAVAPEGELLILSADPSAPLGGPLGAVADRLELLLGTRPRVGTVAELAAGPGSQNGNETRPLLGIGGSSSAYLPAIAAGMPLIVLDFPGAARLPVIKHHLIATADDVDRAEELVAATLATGRFQGNSAGELIERSVAAADGLEATAREILAAVGSTQDGAAARPANWAARLVVVGANFGRDVGLPIPIMTLASALTASGRCPVRYVDARAFATDGQYRAWIELGETLIVNGLETLTSAPPLRRFVQERLDAGGSAFVYIHLTEAGLERERSRRPGELEAALRLLRRCQVLCVSEYQERLFRSLGVERTRVVYNTSPSLAEAPAAPPGASAPTPTAPRIVMVGTVQERKGVELFSRVADLAAKRHPEWRFEWAGAPTGPLPAEVRQSDRVEWLGKLDRQAVSDLLRRADVLFLSSRDDPMPLAVIEAVGAGTRVVSFERVGAFEILSGSGGYAAFSEYEPEAALRALESALATRPDADRWRAVRERFTVEAFAARMRDALGVSETDDPAPAGASAITAPPAFPVPAAAFAGVQSEPLRTVLHRAAERHAAGRPALLSLAERLLDADDPAGALHALQRARVRGLPERPDAAALSVIVRRELASPGLVPRIASALARRSRSWIRRLLHLARRR